MRRLRGARRVIETAATLEGAIPPGARRADDRAEAGPSGACEPYAGVVRGRASGDENVSGPGVWGEAFLRIATFRG
ncbi:MAG TPA: hypothetical protein VMY88_07675, partial [Acidimicrobiales bacterium]|nr:hypothetical protein [Acidimicrobiales bacterium]